MSIAALPTSHSGRLKFIPFEDIEAWRHALRVSGQRLVVTNGCFDILHVGHLSLLESAKAFGDVLLVGINADSSVRTLKGETRPVNGEMDRASLVAGLECVDAVTIFEERTAVELFRASKPDVWVKGGDYTLETLDKGEVDTVQILGGSVAILPTVQGASTTRIIGRLTGTIAGHSEAGTKG